MKMVGIYYNQMWEEQDAERIANTHFKDEDVKTHDFKMVTALELTTVGDLQETCEQVFRLMNVVDGDELPTKLHIRSMSVGDVLTIREVNDPVYHTFACRSFGWQELTPWKP